MGIQRFIFYLVRADIYYLCSRADKWSIKHVFGTVIAALVLVTGYIWRDAVEFRCTGYEVHSSYMDTAGHNNEGASSEVDEPLPSSELAHCLDDVIKVRRGAFFV